MATNDLFIDRAVRDWVFVPLTIFIILMKLIMQYVHVMMTAVPAQGANPKPLSEVREAAAVARSVRLRTWGTWLPGPAFRMRKLYFVGPDSSGDASTNNNEVAAAAADGANDALAPNQNQSQKQGLFHAPVRSKPMHETFATDPSVMVDMMKRNLTGIVPQLVMGVVVSFFFSGFVMGRVPFSLSPRFRPMVQRGVDLASLDVAYFTSLSYYIMLLFALRGPFSLFFREDTVDETEALRRQMNPLAGAGGAMPGAPGGGFDAAAAYKTERQAYAAYEHEWVLGGAEGLALAAMREALKAHRGRKGR